MAQSKEHHPVPSWHLRRFGHSSGNRKLYYYDKKNQRFDVGDVDKFIIRRYYTVDLGQGPTDVLEQELSKYESRAAPIAGDLVDQISGSRFTISGEDRQSLAEYLGLLHMRVPTARNRIRAWARDVLIPGQLDAVLRSPETFRQAAREVGRTESDAGLERERLEALAFVSEGRNRIEFPETLSLAGLAVGLRVADLISGLSWQLMRRRALPRYVLGDHPVVVADYEQPSGQERGLLHPRAFIQIPLDPSTVLIAAQAPFDGRIVSADDLAGRMRRQATEALPTDESWKADQALRTNWLSWTTAERWIWGATESDLRSVYHHLTNEERNRPGHTGLRILSELSLLPR